MRIEASATIHRPAEEVFSFATDVGNIPLYAGPVTDAKQTSDGSPGVGTTQTRVTQILGRRFESNYEITEFEPYASYKAKTTSGPVPIVESMAFREHDGDTDVTLAGDVEAAGFFKLAEPILARILKRQVEHDLATLKELLEAQA